MTLLFLFTPSPFDLVVTVDARTQATHPNMRTYYFCTDTAKDMETWMKVMTDAALVHTEPVKRSRWLIGSVSGQAFTCFHRVQAKREPEALVAETKDRKD